MKQEIEIAVSYEKVNKVKREIDFPLVAKYYSKNDDGRFFPRGLILFAIIPKHENSCKSYMLIQVESNKQDSNDFVPSDDCRSSSWLSHSGLRKEAFTIFTEPFNIGGYTEITEAEFNEKRELLLNEYKNN